MTLETHASNPHDNNEHNPGFVEDTGDTMTGTLIVCNTVIELNTNSFIHSTTGTLQYLGGNNTYQLVLGQNGVSGAVSINEQYVLFPEQKPTVSAPTYVEGGMYYDTTLHKMRIGGAAGWETVTSV